MKKPERSNYSTIDFQQWKAAGMLVISPKFQRRGVWGRPAQSYLIDTLLLGLPVPPLYLRVTQDPKKGMVREVVDGQQRLSAVLSYVNDDFALSKNIESPAIGKRFSQLAPEQQDAVTQYSFICEVFYGVDDGDILKIFSRLNTHSVKLNAQELRNGKYFGEFKRVCFALSTEHLEFWRNRKIFSEQAIARMQEVELTSELLIVLFAGLQDKKKSIDGFYKTYDENFPAREMSEHRFRATIDAINEWLGDILAATEFRRTPLFYSLFAAVAHRLFGVHGVDRPSPQNGRFTKADGEGLQAAVRELSNVLENASDEGDVDSEMRQFVTACLRQTDNLRPRRIRLETIYDHAFQ
ncbi:GmrSD restriction endonuclease domain-containing protein [Rhizobium lentis]|uniref:GmrSD restriction endonuclease domain-containing protein n=1 Tax=Rhizobium lentis TaxID=1138194 RepID=UPI001C8317A8|nr:DUF262 domain-containing protein [Rhizobium lentis]MBX5047041.1 DUF262 domain-containing protein [Rhizobium lentis]MBX5059053.1 DUF262 domain-containing protein [Rhizobium lentis]